MPTPPTKIAGVLRAYRAARRRWVHPPRCYHAESGALMNEAQIEFMFALDFFKRTAHRPFPTSCEVLDVLLALGYRKDELAA